MSLRRLVSELLLGAVALFAPSLLVAQNQDAPKVEVFGGYSWYHAGGSISPFLPNIPDSNGWGAQLAFNLNHWAGIAIDGSGHYNNNFGNTYTATIGPQFKMRLANHFTPFAEVLVGAGQVDPKAFPDQSAFAVLAGGGVEYTIGSHFAIRPVQADFVSTHYSQLTSNNQYLNGVRLQAGLVFKFLQPAPPANVSAACSVEPQAVDAGTPIKVTVTPAGFSPKRILRYSYASTGGQVTGKDMTATVDTTSLAPGNYTVTAKVVDNGRGKRQRTASCQETFTVNEKHPPTLSVVADPATLTSGDVSRITANGSSADNRPLSYTCNASNGHLNGSGTQYTLDTAGVSEGTITVHCTVSDDRNLTASAEAPVTVNPVVKPAAQAKDFGSIGFNNDPRRPTRVDNEAKGELDRYADALAADPDAKGVVVGYATEKESAHRRTADFAAKRAVNTKDYLVKEKGIDPTRIEPRIGTGNDKKVELWIVPAEATFPSEGTAVVDENKVKAVPRTALRARRAVHKKAEKQ